MPRGLGNRSGHAAAQLAVPAATGLTDEQIGRSAELIAEGGMPFPSDLATGQTQALACRVQALRRVRLVQFIARLIALDLRRDGQFLRGE